MRLMFAVFAATIPSLASAAITVDAMVNDGTSLLVTYSKDFVTCAHVLTPALQITHTQNWFCTSGEHVTIAAPLTDFGGLAEPGAELMLCHGNNYGECSALVVVQAGAPPDTDRDGVPDHVDNCRFDRNPGQVDTDTDGPGDACDACPLDPSGADDADTDGVCDSADVCPEVPDPAQDDQDADGVGDACDICPLDSSPTPDHDADGVCDTDDVCPDVADAAQADTDGDGVGDACEVCLLDTSWSGTCPGAGGVLIDVGTPNGRVAILSSLNEGHVVIPGGPCAGVETGLGMDHLRYHGNLTANPAGEAQVSWNFRSPACGRFAQFVDLQTCCVSAVHEL